MEVGSAPVAGTDFATRHHAAGLVDIGGGAAPDLVTLHRAGFHYRLTNENWSRIARERIGGEVGYIVARSDTKHRSAINGVGGSGIIPECFPARHGWRWIACKGFRRRPRIYLLYSRTESGRN